MLEVIVLVPSSLFLGVLVGMFLKLWFLVTITIILFACSVFFLKTMYETEGFFTVVFATLSTMFCVSMWITYYIATEQTFLREFFLRTLT